jgi:hypothetical protein
MKSVLPEVQTNISDCREGKRGLRRMRVRETLHTMGREEPANEGERG